MSKKALFTPAKLGNITLSNKTVMAPMTRSRAIGNVANDLIKEYYAQRATAGLIVTEGISPSANGLGYARIPALYSEAQTESWKPVTAAVHAKGGHIFVQLMHTGRASHAANLPAGAQIVAPSAIGLGGEIWTDAEGMQPYPVPVALTTAQVKEAVGEYVNASKNAIAAGFDGVELHGANGYLIEQFINPASNQRTDEYGGSIENRSRFLLEIAKATGEAIGFDKVGVRLSPYGAFNDMQPAYDSVEETNTYIAQELNKLGVVYVHLVNHSSMGAPAVPASVVEKIRNAFKGTLILSGGYDADRANADLESGAADLVAFGRPFIANPDLVARLEQGAALNAPDFNSFYTADAKGFTDYPTL
ncbi:N-ethylmaleimide reductase [Flexibacter flexilis DSM 6793]|uniref:N-ethylmaleimide reductase n=1 Tax=Flexibacter flexilis DSM 6793 TaxID=927664 RepID=A0A1I1FSS7_9BACT|nr:alkene reductase [Flexibacter flexilis]SFC02497.1 N-ethylmaleimide reductase [Flexibacter flexilis DSM 6793]